IGVAGDRVRIADGRVFLNGKMLVEDYVPVAYEDARSYPEIIVPSDSYFVLGDHRSLSNDSRDFGPVDASYIYGKAVCGHWPGDTMGRLGWLSSLAAHRTVVPRRDIQLGDRARDPLPYFFRAQASADILRRLFLPHRFEHSGLDFPSSLAASQMRQHHRHGQ